MKSLLPSVRGAVLRGLAGLFVLASTMPYEAMAGAPTAAVWSMQGERNTVYLAGSVHALPRAEAAFSPQLEQAYAAADVILMEIDLDDMNPLDAVTFIGSNGTLPGDQTLMTLLGEAKYREVAELATSLGLPEAAITRLEPWASAMVITQLALVKTGYDPQFGTEMQVVERARADGKSIEGLETIVEQLSIFDAQSYDDQAKFLTEAARDVPKMGDDLKRLIDGWRRGDLVALEHELQKERAQAPALFEDLLGQRNRKWLPKIAALLDDDRDYLVLVGTLHFVGSDGVLELLRAAGHKPETLRLAK